MLSPWARTVTIGRVSIARVKRFAVLLLFVAAGVFTAPAADPQQSSGIVSRIPREPVVSHALAAVGYSKRLHALEIEFKRGGTYRYLQVPFDVYRGLMAADSKARFYNNTIRGRYRSVFVRPREE